MILRCGSLLTGDLLHDPFNLGMGLVLSVLGTGDAEETVTVLWSHRGLMTLHLTADTEVALYCVTLITWRGKRV